MSLYTSNVSASPEAAFSFHCTICIEPLNALTRPPVILPCGHTFVCAPCSKRLKKCMECRESLFLSPQTSTLNSKGENNNSVTLSSSTHHQRVSRQYGSSDRLYWTERGRRGMAPPQSPMTPLQCQPAQTKIRLPLPKNILLISLMEIAEIEAKAKSSQIKREVSTNGKENNNNGSNIKVKDINDEYGGFSCRSSEGDTCDFDDDNDRVATGIGALSSTCGTYSVVDPKGLLVLPRMPVDVSIDGSLLLPFLDVGENADSEAMKHVSDYFVPPIPYELEYGTKIQVVSIEDGWAKLARNGGYLKVNHSQLVKVGGPSDKACEIEGMLVNLNKTKREVEKKRRSLQLIERGLCRNLHRVLKEPTNIYVPPKRFDHGEYFIDDAECKSPLRSGGSQASDYSDEDETTTPKVYRRNDDCDEDIINRTPSPCTQNFSFTRTPATAPSRNVASLQHHSSNKDLELPKLSPIAPITLASSMPSPPSTPPNVINTPHIGPRLTGSSISPTREGGGSISLPSSPASERRVVDFRTGFSGHSAIQSSKSNVHRGSSRHQIRSISDHRGLAGALSGVRGPWSMLRRNDSGFASVQRNDSSLTTNTQRNDAVITERSRSILCMSASSLHDDN